MNVYIVTFEEALAQGSTAGQISAVANFHIRMRAAIGHEIRRLNQISRRKPSEKIKEQLRELNEDRKRREFRIETLTSIARQMRKIGRV